MDSDGDGASDNQDDCPDDPDKISPGRCGCGVAETQGCEVYQAATWPQWHPVIGPLRRGAHSLVHDTSRGVTVLFGGYSWDDFDRYYGETWEWDGVEWTLRATGGPSPRDAHAMVYDSARGVTVLFGGSDGSYTGDTWEWDGATWSLRASTGPSPRGGHAMTYDSSRGVTVLFCDWGTSDEPSNEIWEYGAGVP